jgi:hypothetical protein
MARIEKHIMNKSKASFGALPFTKTNYQILGIGLVSIVLGYIALGQDPWDGTLPLVVAPILLVIGYCVFIPLGILFRKKTGTETSPQNVDSPTQNSH